MSEFPEGICELVGREFYPALERNLSLAHRRMMRLPPISNSKTTFTQGRLPTKTVLTPQQRQMWFETDPKVLTHLELANAILFLKEVTFARSVVDRANQGFCISDKQFDVLKRIWAEQLLQ